MEKQVKPVHRPDQGSLDQHEYFFDNMRRGKRRKPEGYA